MAGVHYEVGIYVAYCLLARFALTLDTSAKGKKRLQVPAQGIAEPTKGVADNDKHA
jgi:hypothetical protein